MPRLIQVLESKVAERIAAGEVIERPSSVVKELVENSLDAGATEVEVYLEDGGKALIEVTDNGHGMGPEDLEICTQRHATSKLRELADLEKIHTLGFRGEALPSIAAVADVIFLSREKEGAQSAHEIRLPDSPVPQAVTHGHFLNSPHGTRIQARGLFSQVPARLKFLKSQSAEVGQVRDWIERLALAHPSVGFRLRSDDRTVLNLRPQSEVDRIRTILADGEDYPVVTGTLEKDGFRDNGLDLRVHWLQGFSTPQTRRLLQVVNGRVLRDRVLQQAMLGPFRQALLPGQFPGLALYLQVDPAAIDVNVHPTKTEVRFLDSRKIFREVENAVRRLIERSGAPAFAAARPAGNETYAGQPYTPQSFAPQQGAHPPGAHAASPAGMGGFASYGGGSSSGDYRPRSFSPAPQADLWSAAEPTASATHDGTTPAPQAPMAHALAGGRFVGIVFNTYLLYDLGTELGLVDQHAADERIRYERLRTRLLSSRSDTSAAQALLIPEAIRFDREKQRALEERLPWLSQLGFEAEIFGEDTLLFRSVPPEWGTDSLKMRLKNLTERLLDAELRSATAPGALVIDEAVFEALASEACHSAIRAGDRIERLEADTLVKELFECEHPWNCPHGRPTVVRVPKGRLEDWFQRRANV